MEEIMKRYVVGRYVTKKNLSLVVIGKKSSIEIRIKIRLSKRLYV